MIQSVLAHCKSCGGKVAELTPGKGLWVFCVRLPHAICSGVLWTWLISALGNVWEAPQSRATQMALG